MNPGDILRRHLVFIATEHYDDRDAYPQLDVEQETRAVRSWLAGDEVGERRFEVVHDELAHDPTAEQIRAALQNPPRSDRWRALDAAVVYITGHGDTSEEDGRHMLVLRATEASRLDATGFETAEIIRWLKDTQIEYLMVIVDTCFGGRVVEEVRRLTVRKKNFLILSTVEENQKAVVGSLRKAIEYLRSAEGRKMLAGPGAYLTVERFVEDLRVVLKRRNQHLRLLFRGEERDEHPCLPNPHPWVGPDVDTEAPRRDLALSRKDLEVHWTPKARGTKEGWLFTGRADLMRRLVAVVDGPADSATIVSGKAGTGKSAVLARLVTLADPRFRAEHPDVVADVPAELMPAEGAVDVAVHAAGKETFHILRQICRALGVTDPDPSAPEVLDSYREGLEHWVLGNRRPVTIVIDALDEALRPSDVVELLGRLRNRIGALLRLVVGVRSWSEEIPDTPQGRRVGRLAGQLASRLEAEVLPVDEDPWWVDQDLIDYATAMLTNTMGSRYGAVDASTVRQVAEEIAGNSDRSFLLAGLAARHLAREEPVEPGDPGWLRTLAGGVAGVLRQDVRSIPLDEEPPDDPRELNEKLGGIRWKAVMLLRALAFSRGRGIPWTRIWPEVATAVDPDLTPGRTYGDEDIVWLLSSRLSAYVKTELVDGHVAYRLAHDQIRDVLRSGWREVLQDVRDDDGTDDIRLGGDGSVVEARIASRLQALTGGRSDGGKPMAYLRHHLAEHAAVGGVLTRLPADFLPYIDLERLQETISSPELLQQVDRSTPLLRLIRQVGHLWDWDRPRRNAAALEMWTALTETRLGLIDGPWEVLWAVRPPDASVRLGRHRGRVVVDAIRPPGEDPVAVSAGEDGYLRIWNLRLGLPGPPAVRDAHPAAFRSVSATMLPDGRPVAVTGAADGTVKLWDLSTAATPDDLPRHEAGVVAVSTTRLADGRVAALTLDGGGTVRAWSLPGLMHIGVERRTGHEQAVALAAVADGSSLIAVTAGKDGAVRAVALDGSRAAEQWPAHPAARMPGTGTLAGEDTLSTVEVDGRIEVLSGFGRDVLRWSAEVVGTPDGVLVNEKGRVRAVAAVALAAGGTVALAGVDRDLRSWDAVSGRPLGRPLVGHHGSVESLAAVEYPGGSVLAVSGDADGFVRTWEIDPSGVPAGATEAEVGIVEAVAATTLPDGTEVALGCDRYDVAVWDLDCPVWTVR